MGQCTIDIRSILSRREVRALPAPPMTRTMITMKRTQTIAILSAALLTVSCSLKENRQPCPCWLDIDLEGCAAVQQENGGKAVNVSAWNDRFIFEEIVAQEDYGKTCEKAVPKSYVSTSVVSGEEMMVRDGYQLIIPVGEDADEIWAHAGHVACLGEKARDKAVLHKQFARVKVKIENPVGDRYPYSFRLRGSIYGLDLRNLHPIEGMTDMSLTRGKDDIMDFKLIRQTDDSQIKIDVYEGKEKLETLPIDEWIRELGYRWDDEDLEDININIDYAKGEITVKINDWVDGGSIKIEI